MIVETAKEPGESKKTLDKFSNVAYTNTKLMDFVKIAVRAFESKSTMKLALDIKTGEPKGGSGNFSF